MMQSNLKIKIMMSKNSDDENFELQQKPKSDPRDTNMRFFFLFLACFICVGSYFAYNNPAALQVPLMSVIST